MHIAQEEFDDLFESFDSECLHLETRDVYGTQSEILPFAKWAAGEPDDLGWLRGWCDTLRRGARWARCFAGPVWSPNH